MEEEKKSTNSNNAKLPWTIVAKAYSILVALVIDRLPTKTYLPRLNAIVAEAQTEDMELFGYPCPQSMYMLMMRSINRVITDRLVNYTPDTATDAETGEMLDLCEIRNALDGVNIREFDYVLTTIVAKNGDLIPDKLRAYRLALAVAAPDSANAIIADIEMLQPPMQQPWQWGYQPGSQYATMYPGNPLYRPAGQSVNPFYQPNMYNNQYRNGNPFQDGPSRPFTPNNGSGFGDMSDVLEGGNGKKK